MTFDVQDGSSEAPAAQDTNKDGKLDSLPTDPTHATKTFKEWNTKEDGTGSKVTTDLLFTQDTTVYAIFQ